jgi:hypothetical protein
MLTPLECMAEFVNGQMRCCELMTFGSISTPFIHPDDKQVLELHGQELHSLINQSLNTGI